MRVVMLLMLLLIVGCKSQQAMQTDFEKAKLEIAASNELYWKSVASKDSSAFAKCYTEDCWIMAPGVPTFCGIEAPFEFFRSNYTRSGIKSCKLITIDVFGYDGAYVTEEGFWKTFGADEKLFDRGKFLVLWKKTPQGWRRFRDSFNSDGIE